MRSSIMRLLNVATVNQVLGRLKSEAPVYWETIKTSNKEALTKKFTNFNNWYTKFLHLDEVKLHQDRVVALQERLLEAQDKRRDIGRHLAETRKKSNQLQDEIHKVKRQDDIERFLALMKEETEVLRLEHEIARTFQECDQAERELFTAFTNAVRDSHEKQRAQLEYTKYFGIILSIAGSFLAFCYTTLRKDDLKRFIEESMSKNVAAVPVSTGDGDSNNNINNIFDLVKSETLKLSEMISFNQGEVVHMIEKDNEAKKKQLIYYVGVSVLLLVLFKAMSN
ncbi:coiled-coil domain-containing protein 51 [Asbolus verrucosus]|uniref:Coiled-coil domain-containing protein 51 n=1 Tax=Asbolus verrucosus TaxID=1661398 RepID=A0A482W3E4_ASBVE|nr:coiled-coil domain-containing protein 51 [Asbolus verrucosus]